jgi:NADH-quinone oxidoreductase subunit E
MSNENKVPGKLPGKLQEKISFEFTEGNLEKYKEYLTRYDDIESALLPVLHLVQEQNHWIPPSAIKYVSNLMTIPEIKIKEVISFYDMFYDVPVGRNIVQVCTNITCSMYGGREIYQGLLKHFETDFLTPTRDQRLSFQKMECLGACEMAPCLRLNNEYIGNTDLASAILKIEELS